MIKTTIEKMAAEIGFEIAMSDDVVQSQLINALFEGLVNSMQHHALESQLCYITKKLSAKTKSAVLELSEFIKLEQ